MNTSKLNINFSRFIKQASSLLTKKHKTVEKLQQGVIKAIENKNSLLKIWTEIQLFFSIVKDYVNGNYTSIPKRSIIAITAGILYFISPIDLIPDFILGLGFLDDIYIVTLVYRQVEKDLKHYQDWKATKQNVLFI
jgi:uncharacterized membrane protein YkvA (DUF1232 family)